MTEIQIAVIDKSPSVIGNVKCIVADNSDYSVRFSFDDDWNDGEKKVYFVLDDGFAYPPVTITGDTVTLPRQVKGGIGRYLYIGVEQNGIRTSKGIGLNVLASITDMIDDDAVQPELSMWEDVLARVEALEKNGGGSGKGVMTGSGAPATATEAETGVLYMDTDTGYMYKCLGTDVDDAGATIYVWEPMPQVPMVVEAVLAEDGTFVSPMPFAELEAAISLGTVKLVASMDVTEEKNGETVFVEYRLLIAELTAEIPTGTLYTMSAAGAYTSVPVLVTVGEAEGGIVSGAYMKAPPAGITSGAGGLMAFMMPLTIPCEGYSTKYYQINSPTDVTELTVEQMREAWLAGTLTLASAADIGADTASRFAVFRPVKKTIEDDEMDFLGTYWAEGDAPYAHDQIPLTAQIDADGKITIKETAMESDMLYLTGNGSLPGKCSLVYDKSLTKWTAEMLVERVRIARSPVMLSIHQDALDAADITARTGNFRLIETSSAAITGAETATFHGEYWDSGTNAWVPAVAVMDNAGAVTVTDASWAAVDELSEAKVNLPTNEDGTPNHGTAGYYAVSDGAGGITWVASGNTGGGSDEPVTPNTHGIVWDLVNVTTSNPITSISDGASLVVVLTAADGYTLGDVTVTMGGEVLSGVWDADTATVTIASVTGDVIISCAGVAQGSGEVIDTSPLIEVVGKGITSLGYTSASDYWGYTKFYEVTDSSLTMYVTNTEGVASPSGNAQMTIYCTSDQITNPMPMSNYMNPYSVAGKEKVGTITDEAVVGIRATLLLAEKENAYVYETNTGKVIFAGKNTPYYGMSNISDSAATTMTELSYDEDIAQDYAVTTASILGEETATDTSAAYGISAELAAVIDEVRTAWMVEYGGDYRKIPLIITTDQHGRTNAGIFNMLGKTLSLHDVSKICNLGDTCTVEWIDADSDNPLLSCAALENWCESIKEIPFSKRLDVYGNHDAWYYDGYSVDGNLIGTRYPSTMHHLDQYFRNIYIRRNNNHGWGVIRDDYFNVKYVIVTGFEFKDGVSNSRISTAQMKYIIDELGKDDGYDIVIMSHMPVYDNGTTNVYPTGMAATASDVLRFSGVDTDELFNARKNKSSGTITDSDSVQHSFDFSDCTTELLCGLNGHMHVDSYNYVAENGLLCAGFDWFDENTVHFVLVDRVNNRLNVWKVEGDALTYQNYQIPFDKPTA